MNTIQIAQKQGYFHSKVNEQGHLQKLAIGAALWYNVSDKKIRPFYKSVPGINENLAY